MTADKFHDALSLLPADLIAEADTLRRGRPKRIPWMRYAAMAACFVLVLGCGLFAGRLFAPKGAMETAAQAPAAAAPMEPPEARDLPAEEEAAPEAPAFNGISGTGAPAEDAAVPEAAEPDAMIACHRVETPLMATAACFGSDSTVSLVTSRAELEAYLTDKDWLYQLADLREVCTAFDDAWFEEHDLLLLALRGASRDFPFAVTSVESTGGTDPMGWDWFILYTTPGEGYPEGETTCFHLLTQLDKGLISPEDRILAVADPVCSYPTAPEE